MSVPGPISAVAAWEEQIAELADRSGIPPGNDPVVGLECRVMGGFPLEVEVAEDFALVVGFSALLGKSCHKKQEIIVGKNLS